ncbi:claudin-6-like [Protopterus annectens]|uniref:claudin-6-like n=1 Tax=Protopterus annectens TaxID=7888 RepID=UPI001CF988E1|nr:claudin-6-like [Protopterus annectens]
MASTGLQILGIVLTAGGLLSAIVSCILPLWKIKAFVGDNIVVAESYTEGLWSSCVIQSTGQRQCKDFDSMLALKQEQQAARALTVTSITVAILALFVSIIGAKCTNCIEENLFKAKIMLLAGTLFCISGLLFFIPVCWYANSIIRDFYDPQVLPSEKRELGLCLFLGWGAAGFLFIGGFLLCCSCEQAETDHTGRAPLPVASPPSYDKRDYV